MSKRFFGLALFAAFAAASQADTLYGIDSNFFNSSVTAGLYTIDESTGAATFDTNIVGSSGQAINTSLIGAAYLNGTIYIADAFDTISGDAFGSLDPNTGVFTEISPEAGGINWWTLASDTTNSLLYTIEGDSGATNPYGSLLTINPTTGQATDIGLTNDANGAPVFLNDLAFDTNSGTLYGWGGSSLYTVNTTNGNLSLVGNAGISPGNNGDMTYDPSNDTLFYNDGQNLYSIDKTTGLETYIGANNSGESIDGLAVGPDSTPEPISLIGFAVLGGVGLLRRRRAAKS